MFSLYPSTNKYAQTIRPDCPPTARFLTSRPFVIHLLNLLLVYKENSLLTRDPVVCIVALSFAVQLCRFETFPLSAGHPLKPSIHVQIPKVEVNG
jgi:hypothetical protein